MTNEMLTKVNESYYSYIELLKIKFAKKEIVLNDFMSKMSQADAHFNEISNNLNGVKIEFESNEKFKKDVHFAFEKLYYKI